MAYIHSSTSCTSLWSLLERASPTCSVPLVPELQSSLKASPYSLGKKERDVDTFNECATSLPWQQTSRQQCFPQPKTLSTSIHILRAKFHIFIWCKSHIPNQELIEPVGHSWSACDDGLVTPTMHTRASTPVEVRDLTHLYCTYKECVHVRKCSCLLAGLLCVDACSCTNCVNQNIKPYISRWRNGGHISM